MGRPPKQVVSYFFHDAYSSTGKTLTILENHFGSDGYAAWFKLLECISVTETHVLDVRNAADLEFLAGKMHFKPERLADVLNKMAELNAIDQELWSHRIIWCQKFVDRLSGVYEKRKQPLPSKPVLPAPIIGIPVPRTGILDADIPQIRLEKIRLEKIREDDPLPPTEILSSSSDIFKYYESEIEPLTAGVRENILDAITEYSSEWVKSSIKIASEMNHRNWRYIGGILKRCKVEGHAPGENKKNGRHPKESDPDKYVKGKYGHVVKQ